MSYQDQDFEQRVRRSLDSSVSALDPATRIRLAAARSQALQHKSWLQRWMPSNIWLPATAFAACAVLTVTLFLDIRQPGTPLHVAQTDADFALELLLSDDDIVLTETDADLTIQMEALLLLDEDEQNAG